jgi:hypothetical protein
MDPFCETIFKVLLTGKKTGKEQHSSQTEGKGKKEKIILERNSIIHVLLIDFFK